MIRITSTLVVAWLLMAGVGVAQPPPPSWSLEQNDPNPFCIQSDVQTAIHFSVEVPAHVVVRVVHPSGQFFIRHLVDAEMQPGFYQVNWDGRDNAGDVVAEGIYPYVMHATPPFGGPVIYQEIRYATVECVVGVETNSWSAVKALYSSSR